MADDIVKAMLATTTKAGIPSESRWPLILLITDLQILYRTQFFCTIRNLSKLERFRKPSVLNAPAVAWLIQIKGAIRMNNRNSRLSQVSASFVYEGV